MAYCATIIIYNCSQVIVKYIDMKCVILYLKNLLQKWVCYCLFEYFNGSKRDARCKYMFYHTMVLKKGKKDRRTAPNTHTTRYVPSAELFD